MNTKKMMLFLALISTTMTCYARGGDYYDFRWELKKMEEKNAYERVPSEFKDSELQGHVIKLKNEPIIVEMEENTELSKQ